MNRALARFRVGVGGLRLHVRVLADSAAVARAWRAGALGRIPRGDHVIGFFRPQRSGALGEMVLAEAAPLREVVPHEAAHAAVAALRRRRGLALDADVALDHEAEEYVARLTGVLARRVLARLAARGVEVR